MVVGLRRFVALIAVLALTACGGGAHSDATKARDAASVEAGAAVYAANCASCHGANLEGGVGPGLIEGGNSHPDSDWVDFITNGKDEMPALGGTLSAGEITSVIDYVRSQGASANS